MSGRSKCKRVKKRGREGERGVGREGLSERERTGQM